MTPDQLHSSLYSELTRHRWVVGLSGGLDSVTLLHLVSKYLENRPGNPPQLVALHINHQLSPNAGAWQEYCRTLCAQWRIEFVARSVIVTTAGKGSREDAARNARYQVFTEFLEPTDVLLLAHHLDDQTETLLYRMLRGSGSKGLAGIPARRRLGRSELIRPLLRFTRAEIAAYANSRGLKWINDESNNDQSLDRNYLRHEIIPRLEQRWPALRTVLQRNAEHHSETAQLLEELGREDIRMAASDDAYGHAVLQLQPLQNLSHGRLKNALRTWWQANHFSVPGAQQLDTVVREVINARQDAKPELICAEWELHRYQSCLYLLPPLPDHDSQAITPITGCGDYPLAGAGLLRVTKAVDQNFSIPDDWTIRFRHGGETLRLAGRCESKSLKHLLQEAGIPPWLRSRVPLLYHQDELAAVVGPGTFVWLDAMAMNQRIELEWVFNVRRVAAPG